MRDRAITVVAQLVCTGPRKGEVSYWMLFLRGKLVWRGGRGNVWREAMKEANWDA